MVRGHDSDSDTKPLNLVDAAKAAGVAAWVLRKYFDRPTVIALLRSERRAFTASLIAANPAALRDIRDGAANTMARVAAIRELEALDAVDTGRTGARETPGIVISIVTPTPPSPVTTIDAQPIAELERFDADGYRIDEHGERIFDPNPHR